MCPNSTLVYLLNHTLLQLICFLLYTILVIYNGLLPPLLFVLSTPLPHLAFFLSSRSFNCIHLASPFINFSFYNAFNASSNAQIKSSGSLRPTDMRINPSPIPACKRSSRNMLAWVMTAQAVMILSKAPKFSHRVQGR